MDRQRAFENGLRPAIRVPERDWRTSLSARMAHHKVPGLAVAVIRDGAISWAAGYGCKAASQADDRIEADTPFQAASISKLATAAALLTLVDEGLVDLDTDVNRYLRSWQLPANPAFPDAVVTLRQILSHTAGLNVHGFLGYEPDTALPSLVDILDGRAPATNEALRIVARPGSRCQYSGGGTTLAALVLQDLTGLPFAEAAAARLLEPLGMTRSAYAARIPETMHGRVALGHRAGRTLPAGYRAFPEFGPDALWTTAPDLARLALAISAAAAGRSTCPLSTDTAREMLRPQPQAVFAQSRIGLGPMLSGHGATARFGHTGYNAGFMSELVQYVDGSHGAVVLTNADEGFPLIREVLHTLAEIEGWPDFERPRFDEISLDAVTRGDYIGRYAFVEGGLEGGFEIEEQDGDLVGDLTAGYAPATVLVPIDADEFVLLESPHRVRFERDAGGRIASVVLSAEGIDLFKAVPRR